jgi:hypothetical protein
VQDAREALCELAVTNAATYAMRRIACKAGNAPEKLCTLTAFMVANRRMPTGTTYDTIMAT